MPGFHGALRYLGKRVGIIRKAGKPPKIIESVRDPVLKRQLTRTLTMQSRVPSTAPRARTTLCTRESVEALRVMMAEALTTSGMFSQYYNFLTLESREEHSFADMNNLPFGWVYLTVLVGPFYKEAPDDEYVSMETIWMGRESQGQGVLNAVIDFMEDYARLAKLKGTNVFHIQNIGIAKYLRKKGYCIGREMDYDHIVCDDVELLAALNAFDPRVSLAREGMSVREYIDASQRAIKAMSGGVTLIATLNLE